MYLDRKWVQLGLFWFEVLRNSMDVAAFQLVVDEHSSRR